MTVAGNLDYCGFDYPFTSTSPCVDAGTSEGAPEADMGGTPRGSAPDIGPHEL